MYLYFNFNVDWKNEIGPRCTSEHEEGYREKTKHNQNNSLKYSSIVRRNHTDYFGDDYFGDNQW